MSSPTNAVTFKAKTQEVVLAKAKLKDQLAQPNKVWQAFYPLSTSDSKRYLFHKLLRWNLWSDHGWDNRLINDIILSHLIASNLRGYIQLLQHSR